MNATTAQLTTTESDHAEIERSNGERTAGTARLSGA
jgi:hypothetical protein